MKSKKTTKKWLILGSLIKPVSATYKCYIVPSDLPPGKLDCQKQKLKKCEASSLSPPLPPRCLNHCIYSYSSRENLPEIQAMEMPRKSRDYTEYEWAGNVKI